MVIGKFLWKESSGHTVLRYTYFPDGSVKLLSYGYDTEGNILRLRTETGDGETICDLQYAYDLNGNRTARTGTLDIPDRRGGISRQARKSQLTRRETEEGVWNYTFDPQGHLTQSLQKVSITTSRSCWETSGGHRHRQHKQRESWKVWERYGKTSAGRRRPGSHAGQASKT